MEIEKVIEKSLKKIKKKVSFVLERFKLAIIIPAFNEEKQFKHCKKIKKYGKVLVINDASNDRTMLLAKKNGAQVFNNDTNLGYCSSINIGIKSFKFKIYTSYNFGCRWRALS